MKPLAIFREKDVFPLKKGEGKVIFEDRPTGKAIVFDSDGNIALIGNKVNDFCLLPGGGINISESIEEGIIRECLEEIGCEVKLLNRVGIIEDYRDRDRKHCINYCYTARIIGEKGTLTPTKDEKDNGIYVVWMPFPKALLVLENEVEQLRSGKVPFYNTGFNILRDHLFLNEACRILKQHD